MMDDNTQSGWKAILFPPSIEIEGVVTDPVLADLCAALAKLGFIINSTTSP